MAGVLFEKPGNREYPVRGRRHVIDRPVGDESSDLTPHQKGHRMHTRWTEELDPEDPLPEHPRPQLVRDSYLNLNGRWGYAITDGPAPHRGEHGERGERGEDGPGTWDGSIIVPFSPESELSGVGRSLKAGQTLWYRRGISLPQDFRTTSMDRVLLHFGAVDQDCTVLIDGVRVGANRGGYWPFTCDVTDELADGAEHELTVAVTDDTDASHRSRGKQSSNPGGIWYTPQSGIWQTVWLEAVPAVHVGKLRTRPHLVDGTLSIVVDAGAGSVAGTSTGTDVHVTVLAEGDTVAEVNAPVGEEVRIPIPDAHPWTPEDPFLYDLEVTLGDDHVTSYAAMRSVDMQPDCNGVPRLFLNGEPYFHAGVLDQGYWPDGLYTAPSDAALVHDITAMKDLGFTMLRKHIKIEQLRWYHHCDRIGMLVWQDFVNGGRRYDPTVIDAPAGMSEQLDDSRYSVFGRQDADGREEFRRELDRTVELLGSVPSIVCWVPFNEGWGQFDALEVTDRVRRLDPDRIIDHASGWHDQGGGDMRSLHIYSRPISPDSGWGSDGRAVAVTEYGGYSLRLEGHEFSGSEEFGYRSFRTAVEFADAVDRLHRDEVLPAITAGLSAVVYTQLSDVEDELNGLLTADRSVVKIDAERMRELNRLMSEEFARATVPQEG